MTLRALKPISLGIMLICLAGCATAAPSSAVNVCHAIPLPHYTPAQKTALALEVDAAAPGAWWPRFLRDYATLYAAVKACAR